MIADREGKPMAVQSSEVETLLTEASATLEHGAALFRLAAMEADEQEIATALWRHAKAIQSLATFNVLAGAVPDGG